MRMSIAPTGSFQLKDSPRNAIADHDGKDGVRYVTLLAIVAGRVTNDVKIENVGDAGAEDAKRAERQQ